MMVAKGFYSQFLRLRVENSFNEADPHLIQNWNQGSLGLNGWRDLYDAVDSAGLVPNMPLIFPVGKSGARDLNSSKPVPGAQEAGLGTLALPFYPELSDPLIYSTLSSRTVTPTAGDAALASTLFASLATLDTQPTGEEQLHFAITGATTSTGASIDVLVDGVIVESVIIPDTLMNGDFYTQGGYGPTVTFAVNGTNDGSVVVAGIAYATVNYKIAQDTPSLTIEQAGRIEVDPNPGTNQSEFFPGIKIPEQSFVFDRTDIEGLLMQNATINGLFPATEASTTFQDAASLYYRPMAAWFGTVTIGGVVNKEITGATLNINSGDEHFPVASGSRGPDNAVAGWFESFGALTLVPQGTEMWDRQINGTGFTLEIKFTSTFLVNQAIPYSITFKYEDAYIQTYERGSQGAAQGADLTYRTVKNDVNLGASEIEVVGRIPL